MGIGIKFKTLLLLALLLLIPLSSGLVEGLKDNPTHSLHKVSSVHDTMYMFVKDATSMGTRKLLNAVLDYDDAGANPKHDPKRKPGNGGGGRNL